MSQLSQTRGTSNTRGAPQARGLTKTPQTVEEERAVVGGGRGEGQGEGLESVASDVTATILSQRMEIENKNKSVCMPLGCIFVKKNKCEKCVGRESNPDLLLGRQQC